MSILATWAIALIIFLSLFAFAAVWAESHPHGAIARWLDRIS